MSAIRNNWSNVTGMQPVCSISRSGYHWVEDDRHAPEGPQPLGHRPADPAEANDPDRQRLQRVQRLPGAPRPPSAAPDPIAVRG